MSELETTTVDFSRSFLTFRMDLDRKQPTTVSHEPPFRVNNARIAIDCRARVTELETGATQTFLQGANCKTERVGVEEGIWTEPNADFVPIFSDDGYLTIKTFARAGTEVELYPPGSGTQPDRQTGKQADAFDRVSFDVVECEAVVLDSIDAIVEATLRNQPIVARTTIEKGRYRLVLEHLVNTMNASERDKIYQTDTGPVCVPDFDAPPEDLLGSLELAFSAFNSPEWVEFLMRVRTPVADGVEVYHYSRPVRFDAKNELLGVGDA